MMSSWVYQTSYATSKVGTTEEATAISSATLLRADHPVYPRTLELRRYRSPTFKWKRATEKICRCA